MTAITQNAQLLEPGGVVEFFKLDSTIAGGEIVRFHRHLERGSMWWKGEEYVPYPVEVEGFARTTDRPATPRLTVANVDGNISELCRLYDDLIGSTLTRYRTLGAYLDAVNFYEGPSLLVNGEFRDDVTGWTKSGPGTFTLIGPGQARLANAATLTRVYQDVTVTPGQQYVVKVRIITKIGAATVRAYDGAGYTTQLGATMQQAGITNYVIVTPTTTTIRLAFELNAGQELAIANAEIQKYIGNPTADPSEEFAPEIWYVERKSGEDNEKVEFEVVSAMELNGVQLPRRQIVPNYCLWLSLDGYRGPSCGYTGIPVAKEDGTPTSDMALDKCGGKLSDCKLRKWPGGVLNFGGFPAAGLMRT